MISKSIGLAIWVLCTIALYVFDYLVIRSDKGDSKWVAVYVLTLVAVVATAGLIEWLMTRGLGI